MSGGTVLPFPRAVNTLRTDMETATATTPSTAAREAGKRLERYVKARWAEVDGKRGMTGLIEASGINREVLYAWFRGDNEPTLGPLRTLATWLKVERAELVAVLDGYDMAAAHRDAVAGAVEQATGPLRSLLHDAGLLPGAKARGGAARPKRPSGSRAA